MVLPYNEFNLRSKSLTLLYIDEAWAKVAVKYVPKQTLRQGN